MEMRQIRSVLSQNLNWSLYIYRYSNRKQCKLFGRLPSIPLFRCYASMYCSILLMILIMSVNVIQSILEI